MEMIRRLVSVAVTVVMLISFLLTMPVSGSPGDIRVPEDYPTIQAAIDNVTAQNRTIVVNALAYNRTETVVVDESNITIRSVNGSAVVTAGGASDHVFNITGQTNVTLEGFTIRDASGTSKNATGIFMRNATACNISNNVVTNITATGSYLASGIWLDDSHNNTFSSNTTVSLITGTDQAFGILLLESHNNTFNSSTDISHVSGSLTYGINLTCSDNTAFSSNTTVSYVNATDTAYGIILQDSDNTAFNSSTTVSCIDATQLADGICLSDSDNNRFSSTTSVSNITGNSDAFGIHVYDSDDNTFNSSTEVSYVNAGMNGIGIWLARSNNNTFSSNTNVSNITAASGAFGIQVSDSNHNTFNSSTEVSYVNAGMNGIGIWLGISNNNTFSSDTSVSYINASEEAFGIWLGGNSNNNTFSSSISVSNVTGSTTARGIYVDKPSFNNEFHNTGVVNVTGNITAYGIHLDISEDNTFADTSVGSVSSTNGPAFGICLYGTNNSSFANTTVGDIEGDPYGYGVQLIYSNNNTFAPTIIESVVGTYYTYGIAIGLSDNNEFFDCTILDLTAGNESYGVHIFYESDNNTISNGEIRDTNHGILVEDASNNTIHRNMIVNNTGGATGVNVTDGSDGNTMEGNCFIDNIPQARDDGVGNVWNGNYWSDYIGPGPYNIGGAATSKDDNPLDQCPLVAPLVAAFDATPTSGCVPLTVNFTDLSTGSPTSWNWTFGDGDTSSAQHTIHNYTSAGTYNVTLTVSNACGSDSETNTNFITVSSPPVAAFDATPTSGCVPLTVNFTDLSIGSPTSWNWTFGDGGTSSAQNPSHQYASADTYNVTLTVSNACGSSSTTKTNFVTVSEPVPVPVPVGGEAYPVNEASVLAPWVAAVALLAGGAGWLALRRRRVRS